MAILTPFPYTLHFKRPAATSRGVLRARDVVFLRAELNGLVGWGECGVVPGLSRDDRLDYVDTVRSVCEAVNRGVDPTELDLAGLPSVAFGLETALLDLAGGGRQRLFDTPFSQGEAVLPIHGLIWMDTPAGMLEQIERKVAQGCRVIKLKVGALPFDVEMELLATLRQRWPVGAVELRLDANGAWQPATALDRLQRLAELQVALVEQPIRPGQPEAMAGWPSTVTSRKPQKDPRCTSSANIVPSKGRRTRLLPTAAPWGGSAAWLSSRQPPSASTAGASNGHTPGPSGCSVRIQSLKAPSVALAWPSAATNAKPQRGSSGGASGCHAAQAVPAVQSQCWRAHSMAAGAHVACVLASTLGQGPAVSPLALCQPNALNHSGVAESPWRNMICRNNSARRKLRRSGAGASSGGRPKP